MTEACITGQGTVRLVDRHVDIFVMPDAEIFDAIARVRYVRYWEDKRAALDAEMRQMAAALQV